jgi:hypothetical protein
VEPGEAGVIVATPLPPFRETTMLLRYNTEDVVRPLTGPLDCSMRRVPATTNLLGKARLSVKHDDGWTFVRDVLEALEGADDVPLPARYGFWAVPGGVAVEVVGRSTDARARSAIGEALESRGIPLREPSVVPDRSRTAAPAAAAVRAEGGVDGEGQPAAAPGRRAGSGGRGSVMWTSLLVVLALAAAAAVGGWVYARRVRISRPPIGVVTLTDALILVGVLVLMPYLYLSLPFQW